MHGAGVLAACPALEAIGVQTADAVPEEEEPDGDGGAQARIADQQETVEQEETQKPVETPVESDSQKETTSEPEEDEEKEKEQEPTGIKCLDDYNMNEHTIIFYHTEESHSLVMKNIVNELEPEYDFYWTTNLWNIQFNSCFGLSGITPTFVCAGTKEKISGEMSKSELDEFAGRC